MGLRTPTLSVYAYAFAHPNLPLNTARGLGERCRRTSTSELRSWKWLAAVLQPVDADSIMCGVVTVNLPEIVDLQNVRCMLLGYRMIIDH